MAIETGSEMTGFRVLIDPTGAQKGADAVNAAIDSMPEHAVRATQSIASSMSDLRSQIFNVRNALYSLGIAQFVNDVVRAETQMARINNTLITVTGSAAGATIEFQNVKQISNELALDLGTAAMGYARLTAATKGTNTEGQATKDLFKGIAAAITATGGGAYQLYLSLNDLQHMASKGTVQMRELRQLGYAVPGAFNLVASSIGVSVKQLEKMVKSGLDAEQVLPKLGPYLIKAFEGPAKAASQSIVGVINRWNTFKLLLLHDVGLGGFTKGLSDAVDALEKKLQNPEFKEAMTNIGKGLGAAIKFAADAVVYLGTHLDLVKGVLMFIVGLKIISFFESVATAVMSVNAALIGMGVAQEGALAGMAAAAIANPYVAIAVAILAAVSALYIFRNNLVTVGDHTARLKDYMASLWDLTKAGVSSVGETIKEQVQGPIDSLKDHFASFVYYLTGIDWDQVWAPFKNALKNLFPKVDPKVAKLAGLSIISPEAGLLSSLLNLVGPDAETRMNVGSLPLPKTIDPGGLALAAAMKPAPHKRVTSMDPKNDPIQNRIDRLKAEIASQDEINAKLLEGVTDFDQLGEAYTKNSTAIQDLIGKQKGLADAAGLGTKATAKQKKAIVDLTIELQHKKALENAINSGAELVNQMQEEAKMQKDLNAAALNGSFALEQVKTAYDHQIAVKKIVNGLSDEERKKLQPLIDLLMKYQKVLGDAQFKGKAEAAATAANLELPWRALNATMRDLQVLKNNGLDPAAAWLKAVDAAEKFNQQMDAMLLKTRKASAGAYVFLRQYADQAKDLATQIEAVFANAFKGLEDVLVDTFRGRKPDVLKFFSDLADDIVRVLVRKKILGPLADWLKNKLPGIGGILGDAMKGKADGTKENPFYVKMSNDSIAGLNLPGGTNPNGTDPTKEGDITKQAQDMKKELGNIFHQIGDFIKNMGSQIWGMLKTFGSAIWDVVKAIGSAIGGVFSKGFARGGVMAYAGGGIAQKPQMSIFGEGSLPEAYIPLMNRRSVPVAMRNGRFMIPLPSGQTIPAHFEGARLFANGGLSSGSAHLPSGNQGAPVSVKFELVNRSSQPVRAKEGPIRMDQFGTLIKTVILEDAANGGELSQAGIIGRGR